MLVATSIFDNINVIRIVLLRLYFLCMFWYMYQIGKCCSHFLSRYSLFSSWSTMWWWIDDEGWFSNRLQLPVKLQLHYTSSVLYIKKKIIISSSKQLYSRGNACYLGHYIPCAWLQPYVYNIFATPYRVHFILQPAICLSVLFSKIRYSIT